MKRKKLLCKYIAFYYFCTFYNVDAVKRECIEPYCMPCPKVAEVPPGYSNTEVPPGYVFMFGVPNERTGENLVEQVETLVECATLCTNSEVCETFWYHGSMYSCFLKSGESGLWNTVGAQREAAEKDAFYKRCLAPLTTPTVNSGDVVDLDLFEKKQTCQNDVSSMIAIFRTAQFVHLNGNDVATKEDCATKCNQVNCDAFYFNSAASQIQETGTTETMTNTGVTYTAIICLHTKEDEKLSTLASGENCANTNYDYWQRWPLHVNPAVREDYDRVSEQRESLACGNNELNEGDSSKNLPIEQCDDGNIIDGDGCSSTCQLEVSYGCENSYREKNSYNTPGFKVEWLNDDGSFGTIGIGTMTIYNGLDGNPEARPERCTGEYICRLNDENELWPAISEYSSYAWQDSTIIPPSGHYCTNLCYLFPPPPLYDMRGTQERHSCRPIDIDECQQGTTQCDRNAFCLNQGADGQRVQPDFPDGTTLPEYQYFEDKEGYACECDKNYFVSALKGRECEMNGVEIVFYLIGKTNGNVESKNNLMSYRKAIFREMWKKEYIVFQGRNFDPLETLELQNSKLDQVVAILELALQYYESSTVDDNTNLLHMIILRFASKNLDMNKIATDMNFELDGIFEFIDNTFIALNNGREDGLHVRKSNQCSNDRMRTCQVDTDCLCPSSTRLNVYPECLIEHTITCKHDIPDVVMSILSNGGSNAPILSESSGSNVLSVKYDLQDTAFKIKMRYDNTIPGSIDVVYLSHVEGLLPDSDRERASFTPENFPCLPIGTGDAHLYDKKQHHQENTICCLDDFYNDYTTLRSFGTYLEDNIPYQNALLQEGTCIDRNTPPLGSGMFTTQLLNTASFQDFTISDGNFARMNRSKSTTNNEIITRGYQDIDLFLALEDIERYASISQTLEKGKIIEFFVGMAHIRTMRDTRLSVSNSQTRIKLQITDSYVLTSTTQTDYTFIRDVTVSLREVKNYKTSETTKFATITIIVPDSVKSEDVVGIIPTRSLLVSTGYTKDNSIEQPLENLQNRIYPCLDIYVGQQATDIDTLLSEQQSCALQVPLCRALGPEPIGPGNSIQFTFPLPDKVWDKQIITERNSFFNEFLFIDLMVSVLDQEGNKLLTDLQLKTELKSTNIITMCTEEELGSSINDIMEVDMFLGLAGDDESFDNSLVQYLDVTHRAPPILTREDSSRASNVLTVLFRGDDSTFEKYYAEDYTLAVDDIFSVHILNEMTRQKVDKLISQGNAYKYEKVLDERNPDATTLMQLVPTQELLAICPLQRTRATQEFSCNSRHELNGRLMEIGSKSIINLPSLGRGGIDHEDIGEEDYLAWMRAGLWTQDLLGGTDYAKVLGYNHSRFMNKKYDLNSRYRNGFMISPTIPWSQDEVDVQGIDNILDIAQHSIYTMLISYDTNIEQKFDPAVRATTTHILDLTPDQIMANEYAIIYAYSQIANVDKENVILEILEDGADAYKHMDVPLPLYPLCDVSIIPHAVRPDWKAVPGWQWKCHGSAYSTRATKLFDDDWKTEYKVTSSRNEDWQQGALNEVYTPQMCGKKCSDLPNCKWFQIKVVHQSNGDVYTCMFSNIHYPEDWIYARGEYSGEVTCYDGGVFYAAKEALFVPCSMPAGNQVLPLPTSVTNRRRLLTTGEVIPGTSTKFKITVNFAGENEKVSMQTAVQFRKDIENEKSLLNKYLLDGVNHQLLDKIPDFKAATTFVDRSTSMENPTLVEVCHDNVKWEREVTNLLGLDIEQDNDRKKVGEKVGFVGCQGRHVKIRNAGGGFSQLPPTHFANTKINMRGPMLDSDWDMISRRNVVEVSNSQNGWEWWDFCADPPLSMPRTRDFMTAWQTLRVEAALHCCLCKTIPTIDNSKKIYKHKYTWPINIENETIYDTYTHLSYPLHSTALTHDVYKINPQIRNFRQINKRASTYFQIAELPKTWTVDNLGRTVFPSCPAGEWLNTKSTCSRCGSHLYRPGDKQLFPDGTDVYKRGGLCKTCPPNSVVSVTNLLLLDSSTIKDCLCMKGYFSVDGDICEMCPENTYKNVISDSITMCRSCKSGMVSRRGSTDAKYCKLSSDINMIGSDVSIYHTVLGLLYYATPVEPITTKTPAMQQDQTMLCTIIENGNSIDCGSESNTYHDIFVNTPIVFGKQEDELSIILLDSKSHTNLLSFHSIPDIKERLGLVVTPSWETGFFDDNQDRFGKKNRVKQISLFPRPGYMGPSPPGFVEKITSGVKWTPGTTIKSTLRLRIAGNDLAKVNVGQDVYMISFISSRLLDTSRDSSDWKWIVCGEKSGTGSTYSFCEDKKDIDNPEYVNKLNEFVLDGNIMRLNGENCCQSCYYDLGWMSNCDEQSQNPHKANMYDRTHSWIPFADKKIPDKHGSFWVYTFFITGESEACIKHNCNEAEIYDNMAWHLDQQWNFLWDRSIDFLPGTVFSYNIPSTTEEELLNLQQNSNVIIQEEKKTNIITSQKSPLDVTLYMRKYLSSSASMYHTNNKLRNVIHIDRKYEPSQSVSLIQDKRSQIAEHTNRRMLLSVGSSSSDNVTNTISSETTSISKIVKGVDNNKQISSIICGAFAAVCDMLTMVKEISVADFCLDNAAFFAKEGPKIIANIIAASSDTISDVTFTSLGRSDTSVCKANTVRRLLQTNTIDLTYVVSAPARYILDLDALVASGYSKVEIVTSKTKDSMVSCTKMTDNGVPHDIYCDKVRVGNNEINEDDLAWVFFVVGSILLFIFLCSALILITGGEWSSKRQYDALSIPKDDIYM